MAEEEKDRNRTKALIFIIVCAVLFYFFYSSQEKKISQKLDKCSFFTIMVPIRMPNSHKVYFYYYYKNVKYENSSSIGAEDLGPFYSMGEILRNRYWVQVSCEDVNINRVKWEFTVPDSLQFVPINGWNTIPYGLDKIQK